MEGRKDSGNDPGYFASIVDARSASFEARHTYSLEIGVATGMGKTLLKSSFNNVTDSHQFYFCIGNYRIIHCQNAWRRTGKSPMAIGIKIDFENVYELEGISQYLRISSFQTKLQSGESVRLKIEISNEAHAMLPNVHNLAFGPLNSRGQIDDKTELPHSDYSKVFSSILLIGLNYLTHNQNHYLGTDGSDNFTKNTSESLRRIVLLRSHGSF